MGHQQRRAGSLLGKGLHLLIKPLDVRGQLPIQGLQRVASIGGVRQEWQRREDGLALDAPERAAPTNALPEGNRLQRMLHARAHPHPLMTVEKQRSQIPLRRRGHPDRRKSILQ